jgi:hypothetical protein
MAQRQHGCRSPDGNAGRGQRQGGQPDEGIVEQRRLAAAALRNRQRHVARPQGRDTERAGAGGQRRLARDIGFPPGRTLERRHQAQGQVAGTQHAGIGTVEGYGIDRFGRHWFAVR